MQMSVILSIFKLKMKQLICLIMLMILLSNVSAQPKKQALKFGVEAILNAPTNYITVTVDSENSTSPSVTLNNTTVINWKNDAGSFVTWVNASNASVVWGNITLGYNLYRYDAEMWGKYISLTITSTSPNFTVSGIQFETEQRARF